MGSIHRETTMDDDEKHKSHADEIPPTTNEDVLDGVKGIEAISKTWTKTSLAVAYGSLLLMAFITSLEGQVTGSVLIFVTSSFQSHSLVSTISVVQAVILAVVKPPMAKIADVFGRMEAFCVSITLYTLGYIQMAASNNVETFASAQIFYAAGSTGLLILQQVFIADTTDLTWRALFSTLPDLPFLVTTWIGERIGTGIRNSSGSWRWAYGVWAILLPVSFLPLLISLFLNGRRAKKLGLAPESRTTIKGSPRQILLNLWREMDIGGILLLAAGFSLILVPCTIAAKVSNGWSNNSIIAMVALGAVFVVIYPFWEMSTRLGKKYGIQGTFGKILANMAPYPLTPLHLLKSRTFSAGCVLITFYFMAFYLSVQPYFYSYLLVVWDLDTQSATYIVQIFSFSGTVSSIIVSFLIKFTNRYKWFVVAGSCLYILGMGLMMKYRTQDASLSAIIGTQICIGFGGGMLNVPAQLGVQASAGHQNLGSATAIFLTLISIGSAIGSAISGAVWGRNIPAKLAAYLPEEAKQNATMIFDDINVALSYPMNGPERMAINRSYQETMSTLLTIAVCVCVPVLICGFLMSDYHLDEMEQGVTGRVIGGEIGEDRMKAQGNKKGSPYNPANWLKRGEKRQVEQTESASAVEIRT
ncbi:hypothetical protein CEP51_005587 [Fusarium floridanum]|uniref:Major facilitator superfamily (MFS) profile domain-containing protein n=1 Tax=Fusarium floridanum TaxID=1325733 RepID=A0A428RWB2_9HYPO|nr:hypothetical protein CEP51_005587 [Fusarium floridanum]